jgi:hypothetical protein
VFTWLTVKISPYCALHESEFMRELEELLRECGAAIVRRPHQPPSATRTPHGFPLIGMGRASGVNADAASTPALPTGIQIRPLSLLSK